jgi:2-C-methyl-D-erythritol 4-phosphate cytidylyltransferase
MTRKTAVIVAAGSGTRMGSGVPKQFLLIHNRPVLWYTLNAFLKSFADLEIILVLPEHFLGEGRSISETTGASGRIQLITGGMTRFHSVREGLSLITEPAVVFIHDAVRCMVSQALIHRCYEETLQFGSAIPCIESRDSVRLVSASGHEAVNRSAVKLIQTPQTFLSDLLLPAYQTEYRETFTDDAAVVEASGHAVHLVEGETGNIKITNPVDLAIAEKLLELP